MVHWKFNIKNEPVVILVTVPVRDSRKISSFSLHMPIDNASVTQLLWLFHFANGLYCHRRVHSRGCTETTKDKHVAYGLLN